MPVLPSKVAVPSLETLLILLPVIDIIDEPNHVPTAKVINASLLLINLLLVALELQVESLLPLRE